MATMESGEEAQPNVTVYVQGLNEKIKVPRLIELLRDIFGEFGTIVDIVAKKNLKAKGQAFIVYDSREAAEDAIEDMQGFELEGKKMKLAFARSRSDATVEREDGEAGLEAHKRHRTAEKERKQALAAAQAASNKRAAEANALASRPAKAAKLTPASGDASAVANAIPDEFLPPNRILFLREVPVHVTKDELAELFGHYAGFKEVRTVPGRAGIAFVEYEEDDGAIAAKAGTTGMVVGERDGLEGKAMRVTFQRK